MPAGGGAGGGCGLASFRRNERPWCGARPGVPQHGRAPLPAGIALDGAVLRLQEETPGTEREGALIHATSPEPSLGAKLGSPHAWGAFLRCLHRGYLEDFSAALDLGPLLSRANAVPFACCDALLDWARGPHHPGGEAARQPGYTEARLRVMRGIWDISKAAGAVTRVNYKGDICISREQLTPLQIACVTGAFEAVDILASLPETDVNVRDAAGHTVLRQLLSPSNWWEEGRAACVRLLLEKRALDLDLGALDSDGCTLSEAIMRDRALVNPELRTMWFALQDWLDAEYYPGIMGLLTSTAFKLPACVAIIVLRFVESRAPPSRAAPPRSPAAAAADVDHAQPRGLANQTVAIIQPPFPPWRSMSAGGTKMRPAARATAPRPCPHCQSPQSEKIRTVSGLPSRR
jgi:hypothetical protein